MARVCLISPTAPFVGKYINDESCYNEIRYFLRLGLAYISAELKRRGNEVHLIDTRYLEDWDDFDRKLEEIDPHFTGISILTTEAKTAMECARRIKKFNEDIINVAGGIHATMFHHELIKSGLFDHVICGEGEISFADLVERRGDFPPVSWGETPDLSKLPIPDRELWPQLDDIMYGLEKVTYLRPPVAELIAQRGCPFRCTFCCGPGEQNLYTRQGRNNSRVPAIRSNSVDNVLDEIEYLRGRYSINSFIFWDDQFIINPSWTDNFCTKFKERGLHRHGLEWEAWCRADVICKHEGIVRKMSECGQKFIHIGFESFSPRILKYLDKGVTVEQNYRAIEICDKYGITIKGNFILGVPTPEGWSKEDDIMTLEAIERIKSERELFDYTISFFDPVPGSSLGEWTRSMGLAKAYIEPLGYRLITTFPRVKGVDYDFLSSMISKIPRLALNRRKKSALSAFLKRVEEG